MPMFLVGRVPACPRGNMLSALGFRSVQANGMARTKRPWDHLSASEVRSLQEAKLRKFLRTCVVPFSPFYRRMFERAGLDPNTFRTLDDLQRIPFTTKQDILVSDENPNGPKDLILQPSEELLRTALPRMEQVKLLAKKLALGKQRLRSRLFREFNPCTMFFTTGRSSGSVPFFLTLYDQQLLMETGRRLAEVVGIRPESDRVLNMFPYAPHLAFWQTAVAGLATGTLALNTGGGRVMPTDRLLAAFERLKPTVIIAMPGYFYHVLRTMIEDGHDLSSVRTIALGGENVPAGFKRKVQELMATAGAPDAKVASVLGFTESRQCWAECVGARRTGFHTYPDLTLFEIIDPETGETLPEGETGELVYTCLEGRGSVVLRYRTGDIVDGGIVSEPCPGCGRTVPRIMSNIQRSSNIKSLNIGKVKGCLVNLNTLSETLSGDREIEEWQIEIRKRNNDPYETDEVALYTALTSNANEDAFRARIQSVVSEACELRLNEIVIEDTDSLLSRVGMEREMKEVRIIDRRQEGANAPQGANP